MKIIYRPEIDGLRAVAVISVILYHAKISVSGLKLITGGFIGVDIFFVISGYLICSIILKEITISKQFSYTDFYLRRIRRILPALIFVMIITLFFGWFYLLPDAYSNLSKSSLSSIFFVSNIFFYKGFIEYASENALLIPLLHTWSLSIEEQFYLLFPVFIFTINKFFKQQLPTILITLFCLSFLYAEYASRISNNFLFFSFISRIWELIGGCYLAVVEKKFKRNHNLYISNIFLFLSALIILISIFFLKDFQSKQHLLILPSILATMCIIWFSNKNSLVTKILSSRLFVSIGLISYSLYLWHYPVFAYSRIRELIWSSNYDKINWLLLTFILAIITYFLVEKRFRDKNKINDLFLIKSVFFSLLILVIFNLSNIAQRGFENRVPEILKTDFTQKPWRTQINNLGQSCYGTYEKKDFCTYVKKKNKKTIIIIGDSVAESVSLEIKKSFFNKGFNIISMNNNACYFMPGFDSYKNDNKRIPPLVNENEVCDFEYQDLRLNKILKNPNSILIFFGKLNEYLENDGQTFKPVYEKITMEQSYKKNINELLKKNYKILQLAPIPRYKSSVGNFILQQKNIHSLKKAKAEITLEEYKKTTDKANKLLKSIKHVNYKLIYPHKIFCDEDKCSFHDEKNLFYIDRVHPSKYGAKLIANFTYNELKKLGW